MAYCSQWPAQLCIISTTFLRFYVWRWWILRHLLKRVDWVDFSSLTSLNYNATIRMFIAQVSRGKIQYPSQATRHENSFHSLQMYKCVKDLNNCGCSSILTTATRPTLPPRFAPVQPCHPLPLTDAPWHPTHWYLPHTQSTPHPFQQWTDLCAKVRDVVAAFPNSWKN